MRDIDDEIDLAVYPPPDLVVESVATHEVKKSLVVCRELGVPEVWVHRVRQPTLEFLHLDAQGQYRAAPASRAFPFLTPADILPWVPKTPGESDMAWRNRLHAWVRDELVPRRNA